MISKWQGDIEKDETAHTEILMCSDHCPLRLGDLNIQKPNNNESVNTLITKQDGPLEPCLDKAIETEHEFVINY